MKEVTERVRDQALEQLRQIFHNRCVTPDNVSILRFDDGISNENFLIEFRDSCQKFAFRMIGPGGNSGMIDRMDEKYNNLVGCELGITPEVIYFNSKSGVKVARYVENAETLHNDTIKEVGNLVGIAAILRKLHTSRCRFHKDFNPFTELHRYEQLLENVDGVMYEGYGQYRDVVYGLERELNKMGVHVAPCHCDTLPENWLKEQSGKLWLLDWEYSGMNDPFWDLTAPFIEAGFTPEQEKALLEAYFDGSVPHDAQRRVLIYKIMMDFIWSVWARVKELDGADLREYGIMRLARGIENVLKL